MKKSISSVLIAMLITLVITNGAAAQNQGRDIDGTYARVLKKLERMYKNAAIESWAKTSENFSVKFTLKGVEHIAFYDILGKWTGSIKTYGEDKLCREIKEVLKHKYHSYTVTKVEEIETLESSGIPTYIIHLEDKDTVKSIRFYDGQMDVKQEFEKNQ